MTYGSYGSFSAPAPRTEGTDGVAIAAAVTCLFGIVPIILGFMALRRIRKSGQGGKVLAYTAIGLGVASSIVGMALFVATLAVLPDIMSA
ncbi:hypothetical protein Xcel_3128 [Xylanimonas cellulosilytica DSM 15894]|uniref:DUF4190 domain-containing protein n=1 Tax=Xylanimonas cellulosilytica (strain DSM 15894 / JCM 12276 / CECT 5975 / KCTC 9989 / LMG 20990 / NBRC 107835 / XIL07) TaxID=446471 RepID=D1C001_XYLCX|nr:DUF4190 domain-containing protein [Xylanimonas cellulosilytica]ACZ32129.1 hypothetical protein Xcel_3128 [Xylanimonas cellulosilytica DSM 15894]